MAYSLLGLFDISMLPNYGEKGDKAFGRLEEELYKRSKKRQRDELSTVSSSFNFIKRAKTLSRESPLVTYGYDTIGSAHGDNQPESQNKLSREMGRIMDATTRQSLIDQLYFTKIDERLISLTAAQGTTCRWFLTKPEYTYWHDVAQQSNHGGFLWIKGNPGTGKSTLMKLLFEDAKLNANGDSSKITLSFFFLARGTAEEKSTIGLYRSLLHQLFEKVTECKDSLEWLTADGARVIQRNGWREEALKQTLTHAVQRLGSRLLMIFVDALDECDKSQVADMVYFFEELCDRAREAQVRLQICFSSRHYPTVVIQKGIEVILESEIGHTEDIKQYIKAKLRLGKSKQAESLRSDILEKSSGIFLWVVLVVDILNSEYPGNSISIQKIRGRLKDIPPKLTDLFEMILTRDGENLEQMQICLKWILFAARPLKPPELYFAIQLGLNEDFSSYWDQDDVELDSMKTFVRSSSKGLAEVTRNKASEVQFIHESVRDFLLSKYEGRWSGVSGNVVGHGHEILRNCCLAQLKASINKDVDIPDPLPKAAKAKQLRETINLKFPFLEYSVLNVLHHANSAQQNAIEQGDFIVSFPFQQWILLNNLLEKFDVRRYTESASLLYILAERNLADLIRIHPQRESCFDIEDERYGLPMFAALATRSDDAIRTFLEIQVEGQPLSSSLHSLWKQYCHLEYKWASFGRDFIFSQRRTISSYLAEHGNEVVLAFYLKKGVDADSKDKDGRTPLWWAAWNGRGAVVKLLLATEGVDADSKDTNGRTPLSWAAWNGRLSWATENGHEAVVKLLLATEGVDADSKDTNGRTPLSWAAWNGRLSWATENGHEAVVKLLST
ncbi:hypothetical protein DL98DRAFT_597280 [Cadophora sp. DSE1049]|nr:hypothetical protein DL98DRAFT_597280 [Cadophora sp. DSE1049]